MKAFGLIPLLFVAVLFVLLSSGSYQSKAQRMPGNPLPEAERKLRDELEQDTSILQVDCTRYYHVESSDANYLKKRTADNKVKLALYDAARSGKNTVKAKNSCRSREGTSVVRYLIVENDKIRFIEDYSRDGYSTGRIYSDACESLMIGYFVKGDRNGESVFKPLSNEGISEVANRTTLILQCQGEQNDVQSRQRGEF